MKVWILTLEDNWDEYYEHKLYSIHSSYIKAEKTAKSLTVSHGGYKIRKVSVDKDINISGDFQ